MKCSQSIVPRISVMFIIGFSLFAQVNSVHAQSLQVSEDGRRLEHADGTPFFYMGDTAWELLHRLDREQADLYLYDRSSKGFNVIQAVALAELNGLHDPNSYGHTPLIDDDPARPNVKDGPDNDYWDHVDWIIERAADHDLYVGLLPTWGDKWNEKYTKPEDKVFTPENAYTYGKWIAERYQDQPIIWILGGDRPIESDEQMAIIRQMAKGIRDVVGDKQLITYHPRGQQNSSQWLHNEDWLDFNMFQSGHSERSYPNWKFNETNWNLEPVKPTIDGEPRYEDIHVSFKPDRGRFGAWDVRQAAWSSVLSGACGHTYGNSHIWQMYAPGRKAILHAGVPWYDAIHHPGSLHMGHLRRFMEENDWERLRPAPSFILSDNPPGESFALASVATDGKMAVVYLPTGEAVTIDRSKLSSGKLHYRWYSPSEATYSERTDVPEGVEKLTVAPSTRGQGQDWVLLVEVEE